MPLKDLLTAYKKRGMEKEMATPSSTLAWKIPWTEEPGRLQSMGSQSRTRLSVKKKKKKRGKLLWLTDNVQ